VEATGDILVLDRDELFRLNAVTSVRTKVHDFRTALEFPFYQRDLIDVAVEPSGGILVLDRAGGTNDAGALFRIDPTTRERTLLSDFGNPDPATGAQGRNPSSIAVDASGTIFATLAPSGSGRLARGALYRINPDTGFRKEISNFGNADQGTLGSNPRGVAVTPDGGILVVDAGLSGYGDDSALFLMDPVTGFRLLLKRFFWRFESVAWDPIQSYPRRVAILPH
jgi:DNA-binding beta-propeller fold protein YncE